MVTRRIDAPLRYYLFARPSFVSGLAAVIDFGNTLFTYNDSPTGEAADYLAMKNDWVVVGTDISDAIGDFEAPRGQLELIPSRDVGA
jgi:hypothetical protein